MDIDQVLAGAVAAGASDLHLQEGRVPLMRKAGAITAAGDEITVRHDLLDWLRRRGKDVEVNQCLSFSFRFAGNLRCRAHWSFEYAGLHGVLRILYPLEELPPDEDMEFLARLSRLQAGLVLAVGATGSGKTTTLWRMLSYLNSHKACHIITLEDPIEYVVSGEKALLAQREWQCHFDSFAAAVKDALRQDPGCHPGRRNARQGNHGSRPDGRRNGTSRLFHPAYTDGGPDDYPPCRNGGKRAGRHASLSPVVVVTGRPGPATPFCGRTGQDLPGNTCPHPCGGAAYPQR